MNLNVRCKQAHLEADGCADFCMTDWVKDGQPITSGVDWTPATDAASQNDWNIRVGNAVGKTNIVQAGNWNEAPPKWGAAQLIATENATVKICVRHYAHHNYPGGSIQSLMSHSAISKNIHTFDADIAAARAIGKQYVFGETNSGMTTYPFSWRKLF